MPSPRITIRLSPALYASLTAHGGQLADVVRQALEAYLGGDTVPSLPRLPGAAATQAAMADILAQVADSVAAMQAHLGMVEQRLLALEAASATVSHRPTTRRTLRQTCPTPPPPGAYDPDAAVARMQVLQGQGLSLAQIAAQLTAEGISTRHGQPWHKGTVGYLLQTHGR